MINNAMFIGYSNDAKSGWIWGDEKCRKITTLIWSGLSRAAMLKSVKEHQKTVPVLFTLRLCPCSNPVLAPKTNQTNIWDCHTKTNQHLVWGMNHD